jgi:hypothetical protein
MRHVIADIESAGDAESQRTPACRRNLEPGNLREAIMKLEAGKFYKTESGTVAHIVGTETPFPTQEPCIGFLFIDDGERSSVEPMSWRSDGTNHFSTFDLIEETTFEKEPT